MAFELQNKQVFIPATVVSVNPVGKFSLSIFGIPYLFEFNRENFYKQEDVGFGSLMKKNGDLQNTIGSLKDEISRLEERLSRFEQLRDLFKEVME